MNSRLMTQAEFASHRGVRKSAVSNWKKAKFLVFAEDPAQPGRLLVDVERSDARVNANVDPTRGRPSRSAPESQDGQDGRPDPTNVVRVDRLAEARHEGLIEQTITRRLANAKAAGELVARVEYERRASELGRMARERMLSVVRSLSERLASERDPRAITALLSTEINAAFAELADQVEGGALDQAAAEDDLGDPDAEIVADALAEAG